MRDPAVWAKLCLTNAPQCFLDLNLAQSAGAYVRRITDAQALFVPSVDMLDRLDRWILVLFLEKLPAEPTPSVTGLSRIGALQAPAGHPGQSQPLMASSSSINDSAHRWERRLLAGS